MLFFIIPLACFILAILTKWQGWGNNGKNWLEWLNAGIILSILMIIVVGIAQWATISYYTDTRAFVKSKMYETYPEVIQSQIDAGVIGDISNIETGKRLIDNLQVWYEKIERINSRIERYRALNSTWLLSDIFVYDWPEYPELITGEKIKSLQIKISKQVKNMDGLPIIQIRP